jgi:hypothetical protein
MSTKESVETTLSIPHASMNVRDARDLYLAENGFTTDEYEKDWGWLSVLGFRFAIPNSKGRKRGLPLHDLHHVALGYGTDLAGECEVSAWELRAGIKADGFGWFVRYLVFQGAVFGLLIAPRRTLASWRAGRGRRSLYVAPLSYEALMAMTVGELRAHLGVPIGGVATVVPRRHDGAGGGDPGVRHATLSADRVS